MPIRPTLYLLTGLPGVGKSTVAKMLAEKTGATIINSDIVRRELFPTVRTYSSEETRAVIAEQERRNHELLLNKQSVILDALFTKQNARDTYKEVAVYCNADFKIILVTASEDVVRERLSTRPQTDNPSEATFETYLDRKKHFEPVVGEYTHIDNSDDLESTENQMETIV